MDAVAVPCEGDAADAIPLALLNRWQRGFPLVRAPFAVIGAQLGLAVDRVLAGYAAAQRAGSLSRIGGVFGAEAGGAALLAAMAVPVGRLSEVAALVSAHPGVNHNYEREHAFNLWFVMTGPDAFAVDQAVSHLERTTGLAALRLRMQRAYRIDLGFDLGVNPGTAGATAGASRTAREVMPALRPGAPIPDAERPLAALVEDGLPLIEQPFDAWAEALRCPADTVLATLQRWLDAGTLRRFGTIVRHHELGFDANAMTVFDVADAHVDACGEALAREPGVTLAYRRERAATWPYNLYCMVHGRDRAAVLEVIERATRRCGLQPHARQVLFSTRRFKQTGARRFRGQPATVGESCDVVA